MYIVHDKVYTVNKEPNPLNMRTYEQWLELVDNMIAHNVTDYYRYAHTACQMNDCSDAFDLVHNFFNGDQNKIGAWWCSQNALLGGMRPVTMVVLGREKKLKKFINSQLSDSDQ